MKLKTHQRRMVNGAAPRGPVIDDTAHDHQFSEVGVPETFTVGDGRVVLFNAKGEPMVRQIGFRR